MRWRVRGGGEATDEFAVSAEASDNASGELLREFVVVIMQTKTEREREGEEKSMRKKGRLKQYRKGAETLEHN